MPAPRVSRGADASLSGTVNPGDSKGSYKFEYGTSPFYGSVTPQVSFRAGSAPVSAKAALAHLSPRSTYYVRLVANNAAGTTYGAGTTFSTGDWLQPLPRVSVASASGVSNKDAILHGTVDLGSLTNSYKFEYGTTLSSYQFSSPTVSFASTRPALSVSATVQLLADTRYYYRLVANNIWGTTFGTGASLISKSQAPS
jgi:phosphodiesterase/alkaline phosphatase D-like protein